jgi:filamentous hemagglutinin family protein
MDNFTCCLGENGILTSSHSENFSPSKIFSRSAKKYFHKIFIVFLIWLIGGWPTIAFALPQDGQIVSGSGAISTPTATSMQIDQNTGQMIVNWDSFNIGSSESVNFSQPGTGSIALNRVIGADPSLLLGNLTANGQVFITNGSGVFFGPGSTVDTHGLIATTMKISDQDFLDQNYNFTQDMDNPLTAVINEGNISATSYVGLLGPAVENRGNIVVASLGSVDLAAGTAATLDFTGDGLINFKVTEAVTGTVTDKDGNVLEDRVSNTGLIRANGGQVRMTAKDAGDAIRHVVNMEGVIEANTVAEEDGWVILGGGDSGIVNVSGTITASGDDAGEEGGTVHVLGEKVGLFENAVVDVSGDAGGGTALIGGDYQGKNAEVQNAFRTYVGTGTSVWADALTSGDGGKVILWANDVTRFYGDIFARGGSVSGDGGFVEVSGKENLTFDGDVKIGAPNGQGGALLLDPNTIVIQSTAGTEDDLIGDNNDDSNSQQLAFGEFDTDAATIQNSVITALLAVDGNTVTLQADDTILVSAAISETGGGDLLLQAGGTITINASITLGGDGILNISAGNASSPSTSGTAEIIIGTGADLTTATGDITLSTNSSSNGITLNDTLITTTSGQITILNKVTLATGTVALTTGLGAGDIDFDSTIDGEFFLTLISGAGGVVLNGNVGTTAPLGGLFITGATEIAGVDITTNNAQIDFNSAVTLSTAAVSISSGTGVGDINFASTVDGTSGGSAETLTLIGGTGAISLQGMGGGVSDSLTAITISSSGSLAFNGAVNITGNISASSAGAITQSAALTIGGNSRFTTTASNSNITLTQANALTGNVGMITNGTGNASLTNTLETKMATTTVGGDLVIISTDTISTPNQGDVIVEGTSSFTTTAGNADIDVGNAASGTALKGEVTLSPNGTGDVTISNNSADLVLSAASTTFQGNINLDTTRGTGGVVTIPGTLSVDGVLQIKSTGAITQNGAWTANSTSVFFTTAGNANITLTDTGNAFTGTVISVLDGTGNLNLTNTLATTVGTTTVGGDFALTSGGLITMSGGTKSITGTTTFVAGANNITSPFTDSDFGTVIITSANNVTLFDTNAIDLGASNVTGTLQITSAGNISQTGDLTVSGAATFITTTDGSNIILDSSGNVFSSQVSLLADTAGNETFGNITFVDSAAVDLDSSASADGDLFINASTDGAVGGNLSITAKSGDITQNIALSVTGTSSFTVSSANAMTLTQANTFTGEVTLASGTGAVQITDSTDTILTAATLGGNLSVTSSGAISQTGALSVAGASSFTNTGGDITLTDSGNNLGSSLSIETDNSFNVVTTSTLTDLTLNLNVLNTSTYSLTDSGNLSFTMTDGGASNLEVNDVSVSSGSLNFSFTTDFNAGNIALADNGISVGAGNVALVSTNGGLLELNDNTTANITTTGNISVTAGSSIGNTSAIDISGSSNLTVDTDGTFQIVSATTLTDLTITLDPGSSTDTYSITDGCNLSLTLTDSTNDVTLGGLTSGNNLNFTLTVDTGRLFVTGATDINSGNLDLTVSGSTVNITITNTIDANNVTLDANGLGSDLSLQSTITTASGGTVTMTANDGIIFTAAADITASGAGDISITANVSKIAGGTGNVITMVAGTVFNAGSGTITLDSSGANAGNITVGQLDTTNSTTSAVTINANADLTVSGTITATGDLDITANDITISSAISAADVTILVSDGGTIGLGATGGGMRSPTRNSGSSLLPT